MVNHTKVTETLDWPTKTTNKWFPIPNTYPPPNLLLRPNWTHFELVKIKQMRPIQSNKRCTIFLLPTSLGSLMFQEMIQSFISQVPNDDNIIGSLCQLPTPNTHHNLLWTPTCITLYPSKSWSFLALVRIMPLLLSLPNDDSIIGSLCQLPTPIINH